MNWLRKRREDYSDVGGARRPHETKKMETKPPCGDALSIQTTSGGTKSPAAADALSGVRLAAHWQMMQ